MTDELGAAWQPEKWLYVEADSTERAQKFFGAPPDWPVEYDSPAPSGRTVWRVLAEGLKVP